MIYIGDRALQTRKIGDRAVTRVYQGDQMTWGGGPTESRLYVVYPADYEGARTVVLEYSQSAAGGTTVDWADGSPPETPNTTDVTLTHTYNSTGRKGYDIKIAEKPGAHWTPMLGMISSTREGRGILNGMDLSEAVTEVGRSAFANCTGLSYASLRGAVIIGEAAFSSCTGLSTVAVRATVQEIRSFAFLAARSISMWFSGEDFEEAIEADTIISAFNQALDDDCDKIEIRAKTIGNNAFARNYLRTVWLRDGLETITGNPFWLNHEPLTIYCEADSKPAGWAEDFALVANGGTKATVVWGQKTRPW